MYGEILLGQCDQENMLIMCLKRTPSKQSDLLYGTYREDSVCDQKNMLCHIYCWDSVTKKNHLQKKFETKKQVRRHKQKTETKYKQQDTIKKQEAQDRTKQDKHKDSKKRQTPKTKDKHMHT